MGIESITAEELSKELAKMTPGNAVEYLLSIPGDIVGRMPIYAFPGIVSVNESAEKNAAHILDYPCQSVTG